MVAASVRLASVYVGPSAATRPLAPRWDRTWTISTDDPIAMVSPDWMGTFSPRAMGRSRTLVPLMLPRSSTNRRSPIVSRAWDRDACGSSMRTSALSALPIVTAPAVGRL